MHNIEHQIRHQERRIKRLQRAADRAYGKGLNYQGCMFMNKIVCCERHLEKLTGRAGK